MFSTLTQREQLNKAYEMAGLSKEIIDQLSSTKIHALTIEELANLLHSLTLINQKIGGPAYIQYSADCRMINSIIEMKIGDPIKKLESICEKGNIPDFMVADIQKLVNQRKEELTKILEKNTNVSIMIHHFTQAIEIDTDWISSKIKKYKENFSTAAPITAKGFELLNTLKNQLQETTLKSLRDELTAKSEEKMGTSRFDIKSLEAHLSKIKMLADKTEEFNKAKMAACQKLDEQMKLLGGPSKHTESNALIEKLKNTTLDQRVDLSSIDSVNENPLNSGGTHAFFTTCKRELSRLYLNEMTNIVAELVNYQAEERTSKQVRKTTWELTEKVDTGKLEQKDTTVPPEIKQAHLAIDSLCTHQMALKSRTGTIDNDLKEAKNIPNINQEELLALDKKLQTQIGEVKDSLYNEACGQPFNDAPMKTLNETYFTLNKLITKQRSTNKEIKELNEQLCKSDSTISIQSLIDRLRETGATEKECKSFTDEFETVKTEFAVNPFTQAPKQLVDDLEKAIYQQTNKDKASTFEGVEIDYNPSISSVTTSGGFFARKPKQPSMSINNNSQTNTNTPGKK